MNMSRMRTMVFFLSAWCLGAAGLCAGPMQVTALHPLMADLARQVGGERVRVYDLVEEGGNPHRFEPRPADLKTMRDSSLILAGGKGMENYLERIKAALGGMTIIEVGRTIPSLAVGKDSVYVCCPHHGASTIDPHWWHGIENMRRAARVVAEEFSKKDPDGKKAYYDAAAAYGKRLADLKAWAKSELGKVPRDQRKLVTEHNAFGYFAREQGFTVISVAGLNKEQNTTPQERAKTIASVRDAGVPAVFPEFGSSNKELGAVAKAAGTKLGEALIADGNGKGSSAGFEGMIHHNVNAIVRALATP
jgi:zinc/manganese transport system substrate-binding protein